MYIIIYTQLSVCHNFWFVHVWQLNKTSIIVDASKYIEELKQKVERLNEDIANAQTSSSSSDQTPLPVVLQIPPSYHI